MLGYDFVHSAWKPAQRILLINAQPVDKDSSIKVIWQDMLQYIQVSALLYVLSVTEHFVFAVVFQGIC